MVKTEFFEFISQPSATADGFDSKTRLWYGFTNCSETRDYAMTGKAISRIILFVKDINLVRDFYENTLGLPLINEESPEFITLDGGGCQLSLHQIPAEIAGDSIEPREDSYTKVVFHSDDVEKDREELINLGIRMKEIHRWKDIVFCDGTDPEGNIFQISSRLK